MSIYRYDSNIVAEQITPPVLRTSKLLAWLYVICKPISNLWELVFSMYKETYSFDDYDNTTLYVLGDKVRYEDNRVYECIESCLGVNCLNTTNWVLILDNFIGVDERIKYTSQIIYLEYFLNKWYRVDTLADQIYIENNTNIASTFVMGESSQYSSTMPNNSAYSETYMGLNPTFPDVSYDFIIWIPTATFTAMGDNAANRESNIRGQVNKYVLSGIKYKIDTY